MDLRKRGCGNWLGLDRYEQVVDRCAQPPLYRLQRERCVKGLDAVLQHCELFRTHAAQDVFPHRQVGRA
jgi:hypothetical protein